MPLEPRDVVQLYSDSYVEYNGNLKFATVNGEDSYVTLRDIFNREADIRVLADPDVVTSPLSYRLGYLNNSEGDVYVARMPIRNYIIGWHQSNCNGNLFSSARMKRAAATVLNQLKGIYPTFQEAQTMARDSGRTVGFARDFAVHRDGLNILYRDQHIASSGNGSEWRAVENRRHAHLFELFNTIKGQ